VSSPPPRKGTLTSPGGGPPRPDAVVLRSGQNKVAWAVASDDKHGAVVVRHVRAREDLALLARAVLLVVIVGLGKVELSSIRLGELLLDYTVETWSQS
jgi:hypothetical protein